MSNIEILHSEEALLCNFDDDLNISEVSDHIQQLWQGNWQSLLNNDVINEILINHDSSHVLKEIFEKRNRENLLCLGIASLFYFVQANFTGPPLSCSITDFLNVHQEKYTEFRNHLVIDSEEINVNVQHIEFLILSKCIFENCVLENKYINAWWYIRFAMIYQQLLDERSATLFSKVEEKLLLLSEWNLNNRLRAKLYLEMSQIYLMYGMVKESEKCINKAQELLCMNLELSGELGRRTKFQQSDLAQIVLRVTLADGIRRPAVKETIVPEIIKLHDEVRLDKIQYNCEQHAPMLPITEQTAVLATVQYMQRARPKDELLLEESEAFLSFLLQQNNSWAIRVVVLLLRCYMEGNHKRTVERSLSQSESLVEYLNKTEPAALDRVSAVWSVSVPPKWKMEAHMADLMLNLGLVKASLDLYLRLQMWEEVIVCYTIMQLRHKVAEIIKAQIAENPTVKLWCLLGDATDDVACYERAWNLSEHRSSRAQRHWGQYLFARKEYAECIEHLQRSLEINSLQNMVWLRLGYAALEVEDWKLAASAYRRYTSLEPGGFEAWNNLAKAYIKLGEKNRAHYALQEALKYSFDNWKIWDNFMVVSAATSHFSDVVRAYHHILDIKERHLDLEVLFMLTKEVITGDSDAEEQQAGNTKRMLTKTRELFGRLTSLYPNESRLWELYADLSPSAEVKAQRLYRAYRGLVQDDWSKDPDKCGKVLELCRRLGEASSESGSNSNMSSTRLTLRAVVAAAKKQSWDQHAELLTEVENILQKILNLNT